MSVFGKEISSVGGSGRDCGDDDDDGNEDDDENGGVNGRCRCRCRCKNEKSKKHRGERGGFSGIGFSRNLGKAKQVALSPFTKVKKQLRRNKNTRAAASSSSLFSSGKRFGATGGNKGCYFCFTQPLTVDSSAESQTSDPNSPNFTYGKLRSFIEMNDFYSKECNHHVNYDPT